MGFWFSLSKHLTQTDTDILFGIVYIPPEYSIYSNEDPFLQIQRDYFKFCDKYSYVSIFGDYNSRTKNLNDFISLDKGFSDQHKLDELFAEFSCEMSNFDSASSVKKVRINDDKSSNNYGYKFIEFLQLNNLYILNGRTEGDISGKFRCKGV